MERMREKELTIGPSLGLFDELGLEFEETEITIPLSVVQDRGIPANAKLIFGILRSFCKGNKNTCTPSLIEIAKRANTWFSNIPKLLKTLERQKYISIDRSGTRNLYTLLRP
jgi:predicted transcriptional regulator